MSIDPSSPAGLAFDVITAEVRETLIGGLSAYGRLYGLPNSPEQVAGLIGTLLRLHQPEKTAIAIDHVAQQVLDGLTPAALKAVIVTRTSSALAKAAHQWQTALEKQVIDTLAAYVQSFGPGLSPDRLSPAITAVIPLLDDRPATRVEAMGLVSRVTQIVSRDGAIATATTPSSLALAQTLATALSQKPLEDAVGETVMAYIEKFTPALTTVSEELISKALSAVLKNQVDFGIDVDLNLADKQLLIQQISFKLNILQQSPPPSKSAEEMAAQVNTAVETVLAERNHPGDATTGLVSDDGLSISSSWTSTRRPVPGLTWPPAQDNPSEKV